MRLFGAGHLVLLRSAKARLLGLALAFFLRAGAHALRLLAGTPSSLLASGATPLALRGSTES